MRPSEERLGKSLNFFAVYAIGTGTMIGAGIFVLPGIAISTAGPAAALSFILGGLITLMTTLSIVELATGMPKAGGSYYFISRSLGPLIGTIIGLGAWMALVFKGSFALIGLSEYLRVFLPVPLVTTAILSGILLIYINFKGAKSSGQLQNVIVIGLLAILFLFIFAGTWMGESEAIGPFMPYGVASVFRTTGLIFISYLGVTQLAAISEEVKNPDKNIPRAFIGAVITVILIYAGIIIVVNALVPLEDLLNTNTPLVLAARKIAGPLGAVAITFAGFFATISTANAAIMSSSRFPFAMARDKMLPKSFIKIHDKYQTPYRAIILTGGIMILLLLIFNVEGLAKLGSTINVLIFVLVNLSVIIFRRSKIESYKPSFMDPFFPFSQILGILGSLALLPSLGLLSMVFAATIIVSGTLWYLFIGRKNMTIDFGLKAVIKNEVKKVDECLEEILVPLSNPSHEKDLLYLANHLGQSIIGFSVIKVPQQTNLEAAQEAYHQSKSHMLYNLQANFNEWVDAYPGNKKYMVTFDHSIDNGIIEQAENECVELIVMGWEKNRRINNSLGGVTEKVITKAKNNVAILKGDFNPNIKNILVAYNKDKNAIYGLDIALRISNISQATINLCHVLNPETNDEDTKAMLKHMEEIKVTYPHIQVKLIEKFSPLDTLIEESKENDLLIIGDDLRKRPSGILKNLSKKVAHHAHSSVLIVKKYEPADRYLKFFE